MTLDYDEMLRLCDQKPEFRAKIEIVDGIEVTIFSYMVAMRDTFDSELAKEFRGTTFRNDTKECICRPFPKFFNLGERPETQFEKINWDDTTFFVKHDGSMATPVLINGKIFWKTKKSFYSDVAKNIQAYWDSQGKYESDSFFSSSRRLLHTLKNYAYTPIFEYVAPDNQIVLPYKEKELKYLGFRDINTGEFWPYKGNIAEVSYGEVFDLEGIEGFVVHDTQKLFKMKTKWYLDRHKLSTEFNPKTIIQASLDETIDDIIGTIAQLGLTERQQQAEKLRDTTLQTKMEIITQINMGWGLVGVIDDQKDFALKVQNTLKKEWWPFMFSLKKGKDITPLINKYVFNLLTSCEHDFVDMFNQGGPTSCCTKCGKEE